MSRFCSFCGRTENEVPILVDGTFGSICDDCAKQVMQVINSQKETVNTFKMEGIMKPTEIKAFLDQYVIGQDLAKERISVAVYNHYKRINSQIVDDVEIEKSNLLLVGPTGTGKCCCPDTIIKIRNKHTGEIQEISIQQFLNKYIESA